MNISDKEHPVPFGIVMVIISAASFGLLTTLARLSYDGGTNAISVAFMRSAVAVVAVFALCIFLKRDWRISRSSFMDVFWVAMGQTGMSVFYLGAVQYISVSLGAILFYTYPIIVLITEAIMRREIPGRIRIAVFLLAFAGLVLALGPSFESMDWRGIAFGFGASASATLLFFSTKRARKTVNESAVVIWGNAIGLPIILILSPFMGNIIMPTAMIGWTGMWLTCLFFVIAFLTYVIGLRYMAPSRAAMYYNLEPVVSIIAASVLLAEVLTPMQGVGALCVLAALVISAWREQRR